MFNKDTQKIFLEECNDGLVGLFEDKIAELGEESQRINNKIKKEEKDSLGFSLLSSISDDLTKEAKKFKWIKKRITAYDKEKLNKIIDVDALIKNIDIVNFIGGYTKLINVGKEFRGCCPFHNEKTPSFYVNPEKKVYHCFGCGQGGNIITFVTKMEGYSFKEALNYLNKY